MRKVRCLDRFLMERIMKLVKIDGRQALMLRGINPKKMIFTSLPADEEVVLIDWNEDKLQPYLKKVATPGTMYSVQPSSNICDNDFIYILGQNIYSFLLREDGKQLRDTLVTSQKTKEIIIHVPPTFPNLSESEWTLVFDRFLDSIAEECMIPALFETLIDNTSKIESQGRIISQITLMAIMQPYFSFCLSIGDGDNDTYQRMLPPKETRERGILDNVEGVSKLAEHIGNERFSLWVRNIKQFCERIGKEEFTTVYPPDEALSCEPDRGHFHLTGWACNFIPFLKGWRVSKEGVPSVRLHKNESLLYNLRVPFILQKGKESTNLEFVGGFLVPRWSAVDEMFYSTYYWGVCKNQKTWSERLKSWFR